MMSDPRQRWLVIGGGPLGMAYVGRLLDRGMHVTWVDPSFEFGRMGKFYYNVPSNTSDGDYLENLRRIKSFEFDALLTGSDGGAAGESGGAAKLATRQMDEYSHLGLFVDSLKQLQPTVMRKVEPVRGYVSKLFTANDGKGWTVTIATSMRRQSQEPQESADDSAHESMGAEKTIEIEKQCDAVLYCCGCLPIPMDNIAPLANGVPSWYLRGGLVTHSLDFMASPVYCAELTRLRNHVVISQAKQNSKSSTTAATADNAASDANEPDSEVDTSALASEATWGVVGSSHSAMLVVMNLYECGVRRIVLLHQSDFRFMHKTSAGWMRYQGIGLKGPVGEWVKKHCCGERSVVKRVRSDPSKSITEQMLELGVTHCVAAIGFARDDSHMPEIRMRQYADAPSSNATAMSPTPAGPNAATASNATTDNGGAAATSTVTPKYTDWLIGPRELDGFNRITGQIMPLSPVSPSSSATTTSATASAVAGAHSTQKKRSASPASPLRTQQQQQATVFRVDKDADAGTDNNNSSGSSKSSIDSACSGLLFGGGIAFPQDLIDGGGNREPWIGFNRSTLQADLMLDVFRNHTWHTSN